MTYGDYIIYLKADCSSIPNIPLDKFNYTSGTFEKKWGPDHKTIVLTPNHSSFSKAPLAPLEIDLQLGEFRLTGQLSRVWPQGLAESAAPSGF